MEESSVKEKVIDGDMLYIMSHNVISLDIQQWQHLHHIKKKNLFFIMVHSKNKFLLCYIQ